MGSPSDEVSDEVTLVELLCLSAQTVASAHDEGRRAVRHTVDDDHEYELVRKVFVLILPCPQLIVGRPHLLRLSKIGQIRLSSDNFRPMSSAAEPYRYRCDRLLRFNSESGERDFVITAWRKNAVFPRPFLLSQSFQCVPDLVGSAGGRAGPDGSRIQFRVRYESACALAATRFFFGDN